MFQIFCEERVVVLGMVGRIAMVPCVYGIDGSFQVAYEHSVQRSVRTISMERRLKREPYLLMLR